MPRESSYTRRIVSDGPDYVGDWVEFMPASEAVEMVREAWSEAVHASGRYEVYGDTDELDAFIEKHFGPAGQKERGSE